MGEVKRDPLALHADLLNGSMPESFREVGIAGGIVAVASSVEIVDDIPAMDPDPRAAAAPLERNPLAL